MLKSEDHAATTVKRRPLLLALGAVGAGLTALNSAPARADTPAPGWPTKAFSEKSEADALQALYGKPVTPSDKVTIELPEIAENGAVVPVSVSSTLPGVTSISILVPKNPFTLAASYGIPDGTAPAISSRLKMAATGNVIGVVEAGGKLYSATKEVKVTLGGCGG